MKVLPKILLAITCVAALSLAYPASLQAVTATYRYTGNPFTEVNGPYTTSDFVTVMFTLADPLPSDFHNTVTPTAFTLSDGVQTLTNTTPSIIPDFNIVTNARGEISIWGITANTDVGIISTSRGDLIETQEDFGAMGRGIDFVIGRNTHNPGVWSLHVPDAGSTLSLMTLTLMALGLVARRFQRAAGLTGLAKSCLLGVTRGALMQGSDLVAGRRAPDRW